MTRTLDPLGLSRPEAYVDRKFRKRVATAVRNRGACAFCLLRDTTFGVIHCKGHPERQRGMCHEDGKLPKFRLDDSTLGEFRDQAA